MNDELIDAYVRASAALIGVPMDDARAGRVGVHLARTATMARMLDAVELAPHDEPAEIYCPAPFPLECLSRDADGEKPA